MTFDILQTDAIFGLKQLPDNHFQCVVTSPPYWGLRDYGVDGQIGLEKTPEEYLDKLSHVFSEVFRVLRPDGTLWLNIGDTFANDKKHGGRTGGKHDYLDENNLVRAYRRKKQSGLRPKNIVGIPWRLAFRLQSDGWNLRKDIIWHKPNSMPESCKDRPGSAHEFVFLLTKSERYFYDLESVKVQAAEGMTRNLRSVWTLPVANYKEAHFATFPFKLVETCLKAGTSSEGCCSNCGSPYLREIEKERIPTRPGTNSKVTGNTMTDGNRDPKRHVTFVKTVGWKPSCYCNTKISEIVPCRILDPFAGSGTTLAVAIGLGLHVTGIEINPEYCKLSRKRIDQIKNQTLLFD